MMRLVNKYGLSHVCANQELEERGNYDYPYMDISWTYIFDWNISMYGEWLSYIEFYFRGALDRNSRLKNLFEYLLLTSWNG